MEMIHILELCSILVQGMVQLVTISVDEEMNSSIFLPIRMILVGSNSRKLHFLKMNRNGKNIDWDLLVTSR